MRALLFVDMVAVNSAPSVMISDKVVTVANAKSSCLKYQVW